MELNGTSETRLRTRQRKSDDVVANTRRQPGRGSSSVGETHGSVDSCWISHPAHTTLLSKDAGNDALARLAGHGHRRGVPSCSPEHHGRQHVGRRSNCVTGSGMWTAKEQQFSLFEKAGLFRSLAIPQSYIGCACVAPALLTSNSVLTGYQSRPHVPLSRTRPCAAK